MYAFKADSATVIAWQIDANPGVDRWGINRARQIYRYAKRIKIDKVYASIAHEIFCAGSDKLISRFFAVISLLQAEQRILSKLYGEIYLCTKINSPAAKEVKFHSKTFREHGYFHFHFWNNPLCE